MAAITAAVVAVAVSAYTSIESSKEQKKAAKKAERRELEARSVARAEQAAQQAAQTRSQIREERVRRAQILQQSENTGVSGSSGAMGSIGGLQTSVGANLASASRQAASATAIGNLQQQASNIRREGAVKAAKIQATGAIVQSAIGAYGAFQTPSPTAPTTDFSTPGGQSPATQTNPLFDRSKSIFG